uniref:Uncharacterized protein n=1 Tax=Glossina austeni TaxID=7395 RepID=A0A1A9UZX6_GLOAU
MRPNWPIAKQGPTATQRSRRNHTASTPHNETCGIPAPTFFLSFAPTVECGNSLFSGATFGATLRNNTKQTPRSHRNRRPPYNEVCKDMHALSGPTTRRVQRNQWYQAPNRDPYLAKAEPIAIHAISHAQAMRKQAANVQNLTPIARCHPRSGLNRRFTAAVDTGAATSFIAEALAREIEKTCRRGPYRMKVEDTTTRTLKRVHLQNTKPFTEPGATRPQRRGSSSPL